MGLDRSGEKAVPMNFAFFIARFIVIAKHIIHLPPYLTEYRFSSSWGNCRRQMFFQFTVTFINGAFLDECKPIYM